MIRRQSRSLRRARGPLAVTAATVAALLVLAPSAALAETPPGGGAPAHTVQAAAAAAAAPTAPVTVSIASVSPIAPPAVATDTPVSIVVSITNNTKVPLTHLSVEAVRDQPLVHQSSLDSMLAHPAPPVDEDLTESLPTMSFAESVDPHSTLQVTYRVPATANNHDGALCLCEDGIYPVDLTVFGGSANATPARFGWAQTYIVSVTNKPDPVTVSWLWPLIDRPHRVSDGNVFLDDSLAAEVEPGGRLDRSLQVLEQVGAGSKVTVVIDPELIDELAVMSTGYRVDQGHTTIAGTGQAAATAWLARLRSVIGNFAVTLTPYDDPDVDAVAQAGLTWAAMPPLDMQQRVEQALGEQVPAPTLAWPPGETVTPAALQQLVQDGTTTVVVNDTTLPGGRTAHPALDATATIGLGSGTDTGGGTVRALVTSRALEARVATLLAASGSHLATLPALLAELAMRTVEYPSRSSYVVLTPDRYVDTDPATAAAVIAATTQSSWTTGVAATVAAATIAAANHGSLTPPTIGDPSATMRRAIVTTDFVRQFSSVIGSSQVDALLGSYPSAIQASESAGWANDPDSADTFSSRLGDEVTALTRSIQIVRPSRGSYSLASSSAPLLVTVLNTLPVAVTIRVALSSARGVAGFRADQVVQTIPANSRRTIKVQAHVSRSGRFRIDAQLSSPAGGALGEPLELTIYSSALGTIGVVITIIALAILVLALINRFARRWRHHRAMVRMMTRAAPVPAGVHG